MLYYIYSEEEMGSYYDQVYTSFYEASYWDMPDEENNGKTGQELSKENVLQAVEQDAVFYQEAIKAGYTLSEDDKKDARENYDEFCSELTDDQLAINGMGAELLEYFERQILIDKYKDSLIEQSDFDYDKVYGLRIEARQKLTAVKPKSLGQASRISGVSPADISVLIIYFKEFDRK